MEHKEYIYKSTDNLKRLGLCIGVIFLGLLTSMYLMMIEKSPLMFRYGVIIGTVIITYIGLRAAMPIKIDENNIHLPYAYREKKDIRKIPLSTISWIKRIRNSPGKNGLRFRTAREEYFIPNFIGQADEVRDALEEAMGKRFYEVYLGEE